MFIQSDPFNMKTGGMVNMAALKNPKHKQQNDAYDTGIGTQFNAETNKRDEDEEMYVYGYKCILLLSLSVNKIICILYY